MPALADSLVAVLSERHPESFFRPPVCPYSGVQNPSVVNQENVWDRAPCDRSQPAGSARAMMRFPISWFGRGSVRGLRSRLRRDGHFDNQIELDPPASVLIATDDLEILDLAGMGHRRNSEVLGVRNRVSATID